LVTNDLGALGFAALSGEDVPPNATVTVRIEINIGNGSYRVTGGTMTDC
jgi:hypothetical protein